MLINQMYNAYLKKVAVLANIDKELSSKMARNTFATTVTLASNVSTESISKMMDISHCVRPSIMQFEIVWCSNEVHPNGCFSNHFISDITALANLSFGIG